MGDGVGAGVGEGVEVGVEVLAGVKVEVGGGDDAEVEQRVVLAPAADVQGRRGSWADPC